ncbi:MAG: universal stress protein [Vicinamibacterales bacterium]
MIVLRNILVPVDFSDASACALRYARALCGAFGSRLHLLHVVENVAAHAWTAEVYVTPLPGLLDDVAREAAARLETLLTEEDRTRFRARPAVITGSPYAEVIRYAADHEIDLIVMGTHGRGTVEHVLLGSVAEKVVRKACCPVLTVRQRQREFVVDDGCGK